LGQPLTGGGLVIAEPVTTIRTCGVEHLPHCTPDGRAPNRWPERGPVRGEPNRGVKSDRRDPRRRPTAQRYGSPTAKRTASRRPTSVVRAGSRRFGWSVNEERWPSVDPTVPSVGETLGQLASGCVEGRPSAIRSGRPERRLHRRSTPSSSSRSPSTGRGESPDPSIAARRRRVAPRTGDLRTSSGDSRTRRCRAPRRVPPGGHGPRGRAGRKPRRLLGVGAAGGVGYVERPL